MSNRPISVEEALRVLSHQEKALGNVAAGMLVRSYRLYGGWNEAQAYQVRRILNELEVARKRAARIMEENDKVGKATRELDTAQERLERMKSAQAKRKLQKSLSVGKGA